MKVLGTNQISIRPAFEKVLVLLALLGLVILFVIHFLPGGGHRNIISDSYAYIEMSQGRPAGVPFSSRLLQPLLAAIVARLMGLTNIEAFQFLTIVELFLSLLVLISILRRREATSVWQASLLLAFGCSLAVTFSYVPVMIDPLLLLLACLTLEALDRNRMLLALVIACLAALTKEYGVVLGLIWGCYVYRKGYRALACMGAIMPLIGLLLAVFLLPVGPTGGFSGWQGFTHAMFGYHRSLLNFRGTFDYFKIQYMWSWVVVWPALLVSSIIVVLRVYKRKPLSIDQLCFTIALACLPALLLGDWGRAFLIFIPFTLAVATAHPIAKDKQFAVLLAVGGLTTALARPFHGSVKPPFGFTPFMIVLSVAASIVLLIRIGQVIVRSSVEQTTQVEMVSQSSLSDSSAQALRS